jgi:hypothetical protein
MDDRNCSQNRDQVSTSPLKGSIFIAGSFTERETEPVGAGAVCWVGPLMFNRAVETDRLVYTPTYLLDCPFRLFNIFLTNVYIFVLFVR